MRIIIAFALLAIVAATNPKCEYTSGSHKYNVEGLVGKGTGSHGYWQTTDDHYRPQTYVYNMCGGVSEVDSECPDGSAACQQDTNEHWWSLGTLDSVVGSAHPDGADKGFVFKYSNGEPCWLLGARDSVPRQFSVTYNCDKSATTPVVSKVNEDSCVYSFFITAAAACPGAGGAGGAGTGMSMGTLLLVLCTCSIIVYIGGGIAYNIKKNQKSGMEAFPNLEFWKEVPALTKDGFMFVVNKTCRRGSSSSYQEVEG